MKTAPPNNQLVGNCAEWIVEDPVSSNMNLARYGDVYFDNCFAGTAAGALLFAGTGRLDPDDRHQWSRHLCSVR